MHAKTYFYTHTCIRICICVHIHKLAHKRHVCVLVIVTGNRISNLSSNPVHSHLHFISC